MLGSNRNMHVSFGYIMVAILMVAMAAGCAPVTVPAWLASPPQRSQPADAVTPETATPDVEASTASTTEPHLVASAPSRITHRLARREACLDCHEAETGDEPAPADHRGLSEAVCLYCHVPKEGEAAIPPLPETAESDFCLACHGPFEELAEKTTGALVVDDVEVNPHMYVPHDSTRTFSCDRCHSVHPLPIDPGMEFAPADVNYCYVACHHSEDFSPCQDCHDE